MKLALAKICPCGSGRSYALCCQSLHEGTVADSAEALMRSRYSAYALGLDDYLQSTWHASTRPELVANDGEAKVRWTGLTVIRHESADGQTAVVEFEARGKLAGRPYQMHEVSRFVCEDGRWYYVSGVVD